MCSEYACLLHKSTSVGCRPTPTELCILMDDRERERQIDRQTERGRGMERKYGFIGARGSARIVASSITHPPNVRYMHRDCLTEEVLINCGQSARIVLHRDKNFRLGNILSQFTYHLVHTIVGLRNVNNIM